MKIHPRNDAIFKPLVTLRSTTALACSVLSVSFMLGAIPDAAVGFRPQVLSDIFSLFAVAIFCFFRKPLQFRTNEAIVVFFAVFFALASVVVSSQNIEEFILSARYLLVIPIVFYILGRYCTEYNSKAVLLILGPCMLANLGLMALTVRAPYEGYHETIGKYIAVEGRYFSFPIANVILRPVAIAESCSVCLTAFAASSMYRSRLVRVVLALLTVCCVLIAVISSTRTYLFAIISAIAIRAVLGTRLKYTLSSVKKYALRTAMILLSCLVALSVVALSPTLRVRIANSLLRYEVQGSIFDLSGRDAIYVDRVDEALSLGLFGGQGMERYREDHDLSSHNAILDLWMIGGLPYALTFCALYLGMSFEICRFFFQKKVDKPAQWFGISVLMYHFAFLVSSPILSSRQVWTAYFFFVGCQLSYTRMKQSGGMQSHV